MTITYRILLNMNIEDFIMNTKDKVNKISGIVSLGMIALIIFGYITENDSLLGFPNIAVLYALMPAVLVWFGTIKNGCGRCNQSSNISKKQDQEMKE